MTRPGLRAVLAGAVTVAGLLVAGLPAEASNPVHPSVVSERADAAMPQLAVTRAVPRPRVDAFARAPGTVYLGGWFRRLVDHTSGHSRENVAAVNRVTGRVRPFSLRIDRRVHALAAQGGSLYVGGSFGTVNGVSRSFLAKVDGTTGAVDRSFNARLDGRVHDLHLSGGRLLVAGSFRGALVALNPATGADTGYLDLDVAGVVPNAAGRTSVFDIAVDPSGDQLVGVGNFDTVSGLKRRRAFLANLGPSTVHLDPWYYDSLEKRCRATVPKKVAYLRGADFAPSGDYFVLVATGAVTRLESEIGETVCDAAARFETNVADPDRPTWINYTGGDSLWSVAVTGAAVYVQGHLRWLDNPEGVNTEGPGAVRRRGIGAIDPVTGKALAWNPAKPAKLGGQALMSTAGGLWVGSDSTHFAGQPHLGVAYVPLP